MKYPVFFLTILLLGACSPSKPALNNPPPTIRLLDSYVIPEGKQAESTNIGGLSGIDYIGNNQYLLICDQKTNPRFYQATISLTGRKIDTVIFSKVILLNKNEPAFYENHALDMEAIRKNPANGKIIITSEGNISTEKDPGIFEVSPEGKILGSYPIPSYFKTASEAGPRNNGLFEGLSNNRGHTGIWVAAELPLKADGPKPMLVKTTSPVRVTYFDHASQTASFQFAYLLDSIAKIPLLPFYINGLTDILAVAPDTFLVIERQFSAGLGQNGNTIRIYEATISGATNTVAISALKEKMNEIVPAEKRLLFDFESVKDQLSEGIIDNIEGITFGPELPNGNKTLLLVADNNFNALGPQLNQIILLELTQTYLP